jgi:hypothetical protein
LEVSRAYSNRRAVENVCYKRNSYIRRDVNEILVNPKEISICDCKEKFMGTVNDAIEILDDVGAEICIRDL